MNPSSLPRVDIADPLLSRIVARLVDAYDPDHIYLFGSTARGDAGPDSDYDLLVIVPDDASPERQRSRLAYEALWPVGRAGDVVVMRRGHFDARRHVTASLPATILSEGKLLYGR